MITEEKLKQIYEKGNNTITTKALKDLGFTKNDITKLIKEGTIKRIKRGHYVVISTEYLMECFLNYLKSERYEEALKVLEMISRLSKTYFHVDYNTYLVLLSALITLPDNYYNYLNILEPNDLEIKPTDERVKDKEYQNSLLNSLKRLPISILFLYSQKITKNIFERLELNRILRQININY